MRRKTASQQGRRAELSGAKEVKAVVTKERKVPRTAAVTITAVDGKMRNRELLKRAREKISLQEIGIENSRIRVATNGRIIPGSEGKIHADRLAEGSHRRGRSYKKASMEWRNSRK